MPSSAVVLAAWPVLDIQPPRQEAMGAVLLVCISTLVGAFLARRSSKRMSLWLAIASAMILVTALVDLAPDAWDEAAEAGVPPWALALSAGFGFLVITYFTRRGCACPEDEPPRAALHAPGLHRRLKQGMDAAVFGGMGTAAALTLHRAIEGAALALTASVVVIIALIVHSASEGLALAVLLDIAKQRLTPWLVVACLSPTVGVVTATLSPLPDRLVPILLAMVMGVLCRTAIVGMKLAASKQEGGRLSRRQIAIAASAAAGAGILLATAHTLGGEENPPKAAAGGGALPAVLDAALEAAPLAPGAAVAGSLPLRRQDRRIAPGPSSSPHPTSSARAPGVGHRPDRAAVRTSGTGAPPLSRAELSQAVSSGRLSLAEIFQRADPVTEHTPIRRILRALPGSSPHTVHALITATGVGAKEQIADLSDRQRRSLLTALSHRDATAPAARAHQPAADGS
ncbi:ZIP family metal transporter [Planotetraspora sp. A-T 1434]|uniref:ZIP family metal transporter n=1 Tax=Planotetraspora sp. A-T 1434 TaxID=2979219 RepID=UPI0021BFD7DA|nr:ZIP family metal transporter [Planotetraspora sp. A-T 1434]MCT9930400.1 ZIP family metal transporter [Planotetraspora sp. A-T 1434]